LAHFPGGVKVLERFYPWYVGQGHSVNPKLQQVKRSEKVLWICGSVSEPTEIEFVPRDAEVFDDVRNDAARHIARMPRKGDEAIRTEGIRVVPVAAGVAKMFATDFPEAMFQLAAVECGVFAHGSSGENKLIAESGGDGAAGFKQRFQVRFGGLLKTEGGFAPVAPVCVTTGQQQRFGNPHAVFIPTNLHFRERNNHGGDKVTCSAFDVKRDG